MLLPTTCALLLSFAPVLAGIMDAPTKKSVNSDTLCEAYNRNPVLADKMYRGQTFAVGGKVSRIVSDETLYIELQVPSTGSSVWTLRCLFSNTAGLDRLTAGYTVVVTGMVDGMRGNTLMMKDCHL